MPRNPSASGWTPESGLVPAGTVLKVKVDVTDPGWAFDSGYELSVSGGVFYPTYKESMVPEFTVKVDHNIMGIGASIIEAERLQGYKTIQDVVFAQPGVKPLKYDVFIPDGAKKLPCVVIIHGGGWSSNTEDIMRGLARELIKGGKSSRTATVPSCTSRSMPPNTASTPRRSPSRATAPAATSRLA